MRVKLLAVMVCSAVIGPAAALGQAGYPGGYGGLGAYGGGGWGSGFGSGMGYGFNSGAYGPYMNTGPFAPNQFNRANQPLSPYMNLLRGSNPATNYYFGVRPGTMPSVPSGMGRMGTGGGGMRPPFFQEQFGPDPLAEPDSPGRVLPPAGHPVVFMNTMGYFPGPGAMGMGRNRPGMLGVGNSSQQRPAPKK